MTFNLRHASRRPPHSWAERRPVMRELLHGESPHLIGTQEGLYKQLRDIERDLGAGYAWIGTGREGGRRGEFVAIFYDTGRLAPLEYDHFWLSETPDKIGSKDKFGTKEERAGSPRMVTWVRFGVRGTSSMFYALNTHLDNRSETARRRAATQLARFLTDRMDPALPRIVTGDFNAPATAGASVYDTLLNQGNLVDAWTSAAKRGEHYSTWHGYKHPVPGGVRIDWILTSPDVITTYAAINPYSDQDRYPSDHLPVQAIITLPQPGQL
ncbi:MAG: endonuclease/exonuclease/phosphatase family protein [Actinomycetota bacterium]|nr:endonuclease/exonuclease/phosphatase family protein [Actinomycetota bacterium]